MLDQCRVPKSGIWSFKKGDVYVITLSFLYSQAGAVDVWPDLPMISYQCLILGVIVVNTRTQESRPLLLEARCPGSISSILIVHCCSCAGTANDLLRYQAFSDFLPPHNAQSVFAIVGNEYADAQRFCLLTQSTAADSRQCAISCFPYQILTVMPPICYLHMYIF